jgi:hypothetical protein
MKRFGALLILFGYWSALVPSQQTAGSPVNHTCKEFNPSGWMIPGLQAASVKWRSEVKGAQGDFVTELQPIEPKTWLTLPVCPRENESQPKFEQIPIQIARLWRFETGKAVYAYRLEYIDESIDLTGTRRDRGTEAAVFFYDIDGSGRFRIMKYGLSKDQSWVRPAFVPEWAKTKVNQPAGGPP